MVALLVHSTPIVSDTAGKALPTSTELTQGREGVHLLPKVVMGTKEKKCPVHYPSLTET